MDLFHAVHSRRRVHGPLERVSLPKSVEASAPAPNQPSLTQSPRFGGPGEPRRAGGASRSEPPTQGEWRIAIPGASDKEGLVLS
jgi:hypothetical protein